MSRPHVDIAAQVWVSPHDGSIHISSNDRRLVGPDGEYKGLNIHVSATRQASTHATLAELLRSEGITP